MASLVPTDLWETIRRMDPTRRFLSLAGIAAVAVVAWAIVRWAATPTYVPLFERPLGLGEAQQYQTALDQGGVPYRLDDNGANILVPTSQLPRLRVEFAQRDLGLASCDGTTAFGVGSGSIEQEMVRTRTIRDHLNCTISRMEGISRAQVNLTLQEQSPFRRMRAPAKASVVVWPSRGSRIEPETVEAIAYLVSSAVDGLEHDQVAVINGNGGFALQAPSDGRKSGVRSSNELTVQHGIEASLVEKVERLLGPLMTPGEFQVQVAAELDWTEVVRRSEQFDPEAQAIVREEEASVPAGASGPGSPPYTSEQRESRYSRTVEDLTSAPGSVQRLSVAVLVNEQAEIFGGGPSGTNPPDPRLRAQQLARIDSVVRAGVGYDSTRGDQVIVTAIPFQMIEDSVLVATTGGGGIEAPMMVIEQLVRPVLGLIAIAVVAFLALKLMQIQRTAPPAFPTSTGAPAMSRPGVGQTAMPSRPEGALASSSTASAPAGGPDHDPNAAAQVVRAWLQGA